MPSRAPNILFILSDQQRWDTVGCYGAPIVEGLTPNLDRMAASGVRFQNTFTCQPVCGPARSCLQSGVYATQTGCITNNIALPLNQVTIAKLLGAAGYETGYIGKWHLASDKEHRHDTGPIPPERRGGYRDHWLASDLLEFTSHGYEGYMHDGEGRRNDFEGYRVDCMTNFVLDYLRGYATRRAGRPFLLFTSFIEPHHQNDLNRYIGPIGSKQRFAKFNVPGDLRGTSPEPGRRCDWPQQMPDYLGCCSSLDQNLGRILGQLDILGLAQETLVIYTSDHGSHFCTRNAEYKRSAHDASIRVPLIARGPGFRGGAVIEDLVSLIDLPASVLAASGQSVPASFRGRPLQALVDGSAKDWPKEVFVQVSEDHTARAIRTHRWKYSVWVPRDKTGSAGDRSQYWEQYLYDLQADPHERVNLVGEPGLAAVRSGLADVLKRRMAHAGEPEPIILPA
ncbi:MAG: sulfatase-like hydrolase/transferase [Planctomycetota bacterium]|nr:sulfatase-like hydrolase/transferase [Planctomycetota bacterium]